MSVFFHSSLFYFVIIQSVIILCEYHIAKIMNDHGEIPILYHTAIYNFYMIITYLIIIVSVFISCFKYSWWLLILFPLLNFICSTIITSLIYTLFLKNLRIDICRFTLLCLTTIFNVLIIITWF